MARACTSCPSSTHSRDSASTTCASVQKASVASGTSRANRAPAPRSASAYRAPRSSDMSEAAVIRVILVDDHPVVRDGMANIVNQQKDMRVVAEADDGDAAIALYDEHRPDVMVLDLRMPGRDGVSVVEVVLKKNPKARLLIMTTYDGDEDIFKSLSRGAKGYLLKDAPRQEILLAIRAVAVDQRYTPPPPPPHTHK